MLEGQALGRMNATELARKLAPLNTQPNDPPMVVIGADARTPHQAVVVVMEASRMAGLSKITFMTNQPGRRS
jgi:biopolymer transport protein ExbD